MNFLLHRHLASAELGSAVAGVGAMLPDLWRLCDRRMPAHPEALERSDEEPAGLMTELQRGVIHHVAADRWFHHTQVFEQGEHATAEAFKEAGVPKTAVFAHIAWELCLDGALLVRVGAEAELERLQRHFATVDADTMQALARQIAGDTLIDEGFGRRMSQLRNGLLEGSWIRGYLNGEGLCDRLAGVRTRVGLATFDALERRRLTQVLSSRLAAASTALVELFEDRARWLDRIGQPLLQREGAA